MNAIYACMLVVSIIIMYVIGCLCFCACCDNCFGCGCWQVPLWLQLLTLRGPLQRLGNVHVVDNICLDAVATPLDLQHRTMGQQMSMGCWQDVLLQLQPAALLHLGDQPGHLVAVERIAGVLSSDVLHLASQM